MSLFAFTFFTLIAALAGYGGLLVLVPKGNLLHELIHLPLFWIRAFSHPIDQIDTVKHHYGTHPRQYLLFCRPLQGIDPEKPLMIYFHGGGWRSGSPERFRINAQALAANGYGVFMPSCRRTPKYCYSDVREDLSRSLALIQSLMADQGMEGKKIILGGMSSGANLSALSFFNRTILKNGGLQVDNFAGLFLLGAPLDLNLMPDSFILRSFAGPRKTPLFQEANPINYLKENEPTPVLIIQGDKDGLVSCKNVQSFVSRFNSLNPASFAYHELSDVTHLETAKWSFQNNETRRLLIKWLMEISKD